MQGIRAENGEGQIKKIRADHEKSRMREIWTACGKRPIGSTLQVEITARCNLSCPACNQGRSGGKVHGKDPDDMNQVFWKLLTDLENSRYQPHELQLFWFGEPLIHRDFAHIFQVLILEKHQKGLFDQIDLHTNGLLMDDAIIDMFLLAGAIMPEITFSLDAVRPETYKKIRCGGELENAVNNIKRFLTRREELGQVLPVCRVQFLLQENNAHECQEFIDYWEDTFSNISRQGLILKHIKDYCEKDNFRKLWPSRINHPIYPHEEWKFSTFKALQHWKDSIWIKRLNILPLEKQAQMDKLFEETMVKCGIISQEKESCRIMAEIDNRLVLQAMEARKGIDNPFFRDNESENSAGKESTKDLSDKKLSLPTKEKEDKENPDDKEELGQIGKEELISVENEDWLGRPPCVSPFLRPVIRFDGVVTVCCNDPECSLALGDLYSHTLDELWDGQRANEIRKIHLLGEFEKLEICKNCRNLDGAGLTVDQARALIENWPNMGLEMALSGRIK